MNLTNFVGGGVDKTVSQIRGFRILLKVLSGHTPPDIVATIIQVMKKSSVGEFNLIYKSMKYTYKMLGLEHKPYTIEDILEFHDNTYTDMEVKN